MDNPLGTKSFSTEACRFLESSQNSYLIFVQGEVGMGVRVCRDEEGGSSRGEDHKGGGV